MAKTYQTAIAQMFRLLHSNIVAYYYRRILQLMQEKQAALERLEQMENNVMIIMISERKKMNPTRFVQAVEDLISKWEIVEKADISDQHPTGVLAEKRSSEVLAHNYPTGVTSYLDSILESIVPLSPQGPKWRCNVYNLPAKMTDSNLLLLFKDDTRMLGVKQAIVLKDFNGQSRSCGFVVCETEEQRNAIAKSSISIQGKRLVFYAM